MTLTRTVIGAAAAILVTGAAAGCATEVAGNAERETETTSPAPPSSPSSSPSAAPSAVSTPQLPGLLLKRSELAQTIGEKEVTQLDTIERWPWVHNSTVEPYYCQDEVTPGDSRALYESAIALRGDVNRGENKQAVTQIVTLFPNARDAEAVMAKVSDLWQNCKPDTELIMVLGTGADAARQQWLMGPMISSRSPARLELSYTRTSGEPRVCNRVLQASGNVVAEATICGTGDTAGQADTVVEGIIDNIDA